MSGAGDPPDNGGNRTVFRPSPLSGGQGGGPPGMPPQPAAPPPGSGGYAPFGTPPAPPPPPGPDGYAPFGTPPAAAPLPPPASAAMAPQARLNDDDIPMPTTVRDVRNVLLNEAAPVLALIASVRSGRARIAMPDLHRQASEAITAFNGAIRAYPEETRQRASYALAATVDDIAQNLPGIGHDGAEWARRSLVVQFFRENIGGDRFWQLVDDMLARPAQNADMIEFFHACLAAGFEGRFRVMPDGRTRLKQIMANLYGALEHPRSLSQLEISPQWKGANAPLARMGLWNRVWLAAAAALVLLLLVFTVLRLVLMWSGEDSWKAVSALSPQEPLRLSRVGTPPPVPSASAQLSGLRKFLEPEIREKLVVVEEDAQSVRVRTTVGTLFESASDQLVPGRAALFERIGRALEGEKGAVTIEGHADSDKVSSLAFPDNMALSKARAEAVSKIVAAAISNPGRITVAGYGDTRPIASNDTADGKARNRRVEIVVPRRQ